MHANRASLADKDGWCIGGGMKSGKNKKVNILRQIMLQSDEKRVPCERKEYSEIQGEIE